MKQKFDRAVAIKAAKIIVDALKPHVEKLLVCGSLRRRKPRVSDVEIVYIPKFHTEAFDLLSSHQVNDTDRKLEELLAAGVLEKRPNVNGHTSWGEKIKLAVEKSTGVPVDLFATDARCYWNTVFCRTGPAESNIRIAQRAQERGLSWKPFGVGFRQNGEDIVVESEEHIYQLLGLAYRQPWERI